MCEAHTHQRRHNKDTSHFATLCFTLTFGSKLREVRAMRQRRSLVTAMFDPDSFNFNYVICNEIVSYAKGLNSKFEQHFV